jgi:SAM-dependent methyltransferase
MSQYGGDVYLLDYSKESLRLVRSYMKKDEVTLIQADAIYSPFNNDTFDIVFHQGLLEHFKSPVPLLKENYRILKKGGWFVVDVPQTFHLYTLIKHILMPLGMWFGGWERQFTIDSLSNLLEKTGFQPVHYYGDWSRPGIIYKIIREVFKKFRIPLPMFPKYFSKLTERLYEMQGRLRKKKIFLYTVLSIGIIARKI